MFQYYKNNLQKVKTRSTVILSALTLAFSGAGVFSLAVFGTAYAANPSGVSIFNNIPNPTPGNVYSMAFEATSTSEFGGQVSFQGNLRTNPTVTVLMSSWGCQNGSWFNNNCSTTPGSTFSEPLTLNVYNVGTGNSVGSQVASVTSTFNIPYRPSADNTHCTGADVGKWYSTVDQTCYNGFATPVSFNLSGVTLPSTAIITVAYNTSDYGAQPYGDSTACHATAAGCGYDSLNVGLVSGPATVGSYPVVNSDYLNSSWNGAFCDNGTAGTGTLRFDTGSSGSDSACPLEPAFTVSAGLPTDISQCKNNGWQNYGTVFKNQGDCVSYVANGGKN